MTIGRLTLAAALALALTGAALAQSRPGGTEGNMNNPGSVKSDSEKAAGGQTGPASTGTTMRRPDTGDTGNAKSTDGVTGNGAARAPK